MGGIERVIQTIALGLDPAKYNLQIWCLARGGTIADDLIRRGLAVRILGMTSYYNPARVCDLARMLDRERFDIVHTHGYFASTFARLAVLWIRRTRVIRHIHTTYFAFKPRNRRIEALLSLMSDRVICVSGAVADFAAESLGIPPQKLRVVYNAPFADPAGCPEAEVGRWRVKLGLNGKHFVVLSIASLTVNKGHEVIIRAMKQVVDRHPNARCLIVGDGKEKMCLEDLVGSLGLQGRVFLLGMQPDVSPFLRLADVLVLGSVEREGLSVALIEGAAAGIPLVGSDLGGIPEVIEHGVNGFLFRPGDSRELARALERLITAPDLRERMGRSSRALQLERFPREGMVGRIERVYDEVLQGRSHAS